MKAKETATNDESQALQKRLFSKDPFCSSVDHEVENEP